MSQTRFDGSDVSPSKEPRLFERFGKPSLITAACLLVVFLLGRMIAPLPEMEEVPAKEPAGGATSTPQILLDASEGFLRVAARAATAAQASISDVDRVFTLPAERASSDLQRPAAAISSLINAPLTQEQMQVPANLSRAAVPHTTIPDRPRLEIVTHTVQPGDTVFDIAAAYGVSPETIMWSNGELENHPDDLSVGQELVIIPVSGVYHQVSAGEKLDSLAKKYKVDPAAISGYALNALGPDGALTEGQWLVIPGGEKPYVPRQVRSYSGPVPEGASKGSGNFGWPVSGSITQGYWRLHRAIDIGAPKGTPVGAADSGFVVFAGWDNSGYGNMVIIDHGNGFLSCYAHLNEINSAIGDSVGKGQLIGKVGSTGRSTGSHLHFEIREGGVQRNPLGFLP